jgi:hypothetical protein
MTLLSSCDPREFRTILRAREDEEKLPQVTFNSGGERRCSA